MIPRRTLGLVVALALLSVVGGCGSDDASPAERGATHPTTSGHAATPTTSAPINELQCISRMPGEILTEAEAVVRFSTAKACPGYVTVRPGTQVTFHNEDSTAHRVTINATNATGETLPEVASGVAQPGATWVLAFDDLGMFSYTLDAIPTFRGTVEVTEGDPMHHG